MIAGLLLLSLPCGLGLAVNIAEGNLTLHAWVAYGNPEPCGMHTVKPSQGCRPHYERLQVTSFGKPSAPPGTALVKVAASSVNPCDWKRFVISPFPYVPGSDFAGVVEQAGSSCGFKAGDEVWGLSLGTYSEYIVHPCSNLGLKPKSYPFEEAGSMGVVGLTGLQALRWAGAPWGASPGPRVLVLGGSGGTGHVGIQLAKAFGASEVITTCSPGNFDFVRELGADRALDYHTENWWEVLPRGSVDVIYDCISLPGTGDRAYQVLADGGKFMTLLKEARVSPAVAKTRPSVSQYYFTCNETETRHLDMLRREAEAGKLNVTIFKTYAGLEKVAEAFNETMEGHNVGKIALRIG